MEAFYHYLWRHSLLGQPLALSDGTPVEIISPGIHNHDAGPDFFNARLRIGSQTWQGNVEIHVKASDWHRHGHDADMAYDGVILHAVAVDDFQACRHNGDPIPTAVMTMPEEFFRMLNALQIPADPVRCAPMLHAMPRLAVTDWIESLALERLQQKALRIHSEYTLADGDWHKAAFVAFARALGFGLNSLPFEMLARSIHMGYLGRHSDNLFQIEAILFGQAGMLDMSEHIFDEYYQALCREYYFLARKYSLKPMRRDLWKYARTRPQNFPHRRIALLAKACEGGFRLLSPLLESQSPESLRQIFSLTLEGYWLSHSGFDAPASLPAAALSPRSLDLISINFAAPMIYARHSAAGHCDRAETAIDLLRALPPEKNSLISVWTFAGVKCSDAFESQALIHLRKEYCDKNRCLDCRWGHRLLREAMPRQKCRLNLAT